jgi:hypothetical protein
MTESPRAKARSDFRNKSTHKNESSFFHLIEDTYIRLGNFSFQSSATVFCGVSGCEM